MNEDRWLKDLAQRAAEREAGTGVAAHWQALAAGTLLAAEEERLRAQADESEEIRDGLELFRPLGSDFHARMVAEMRSHVGPKATAAPPEQDKPARVISFPRTPHRRRWPQALVTLAALVVAALGLPWLLPSGDGTPLPAYEIELRGIALVRSNETTSQPAIFAPKKSFEIVLTPRDTADERVRVRFFVTRDGRWRIWPVPEDACQVMTSGAVRVKCPMTGDLVLEPGLWTLVAVVGRPSDLPSSEEARACFEDGEGCPDDGGWQMDSEVFRVADDG